MIYLVPVLLFTYLTTNSPSYQILYNTGVFSLWLPSSTCIILCVVVWFVVKVLVRTISNSANDHLAHLHHGNTLELVWTITPACTLSLWPSISLISWGYLFRGFKYYLANTVSYFISFWFGLGGYLDSFHWSKIMVLLLLLVLLSLLCCRRFVLTFITLFGDTGICLFHSLMTSLPREK